MQPQQEDQQLHWDRHGSSFNFTLMLSLAIAVIGILTQEPFVVVVGLAVAAFSWLTTPGQYMLYPDRLVIVYGRPRVRHVLFQDISEVQMLKFAFGARLLVRLQKGSRVLIQPKDAEQFEVRFKGALESYISEHGGPQEAQQSPEDPPDQAPPDQGNWPSRE